MPFFATFTGASSFEVLGGGRRSACNSTRQLGLFTLDESAPMSPDKHVCPSQVAFADRIPVISRAGSAREHCYIEFSSCNQPLIADGATKLLAECASAQAAAGVTSDIAFGRCRSRRRLASANCPSAPRRLATPFVPYLSGSTPFIKIKDTLTALTSSGARPWTVARAHRLLAPSPSASKRRRPKFSFGQPQGSRATQNAQKPMWQNAQQHRSDPIHRLHRTQPTRPTLA